MGGGGSGGTGAVFAPIFGVLLKLNPTVPMYSLPMFFAM